MLIFYKIYVWLKILVSVSLHLSVDTGSGGYLIAPVNLYHWDPIIIQLIIIIDVIPPQKAP